MSRKIIKQEYLPLILRYYTQNPQERNTKHFQAPLSSVRFDRITSIHLYKLFSECQQQPNIGRVLKSMDDLLGKQGKSVNADKVG